MVKLEKRIIDWVNHHLIYISMFFVILAAIYMRAAAVGFMGIDFHFSLYDIPGNCNSVLYRITADAAMRNPDWAVMLLKAFSYAGDFCVAMFVAILFCKDGQKITDTRTFLIVTACLLSPVSLIYSVGGMEPDSISMCLLVLGFCFYKKKSIIWAVPVMALAAFFYPAYWPVVILALGYMVVKRHSNGENNKQTAIAIAFMGILLAVSVLVENLLGVDGYYWGKIFVFNPATETVYADLGEWLLKMFYIYGYAVATGTLIASFKYRKLRITALIMQILVIMYVGWNITSHLVVK